MEIVLDELGKKFNKTWIFKALNHTFLSNSCTAITGSNGSGKSTLLKILSAFNEPTKGNIIWNTKNKDDSFIAETINFVAPYINLIEEMTLEEHLRFHATFKEPLTDFDTILKISNLSKARNKSIAHFSSGMKQRLKLALGIYFKCDLLLLDEPTSNMDEEGQAWYKTELLKIKTRQTTIIASNARLEYDFCDFKLHIESYKPQEKI